MPEAIGTAQIVAALRNRHAGEEWAFFEQLRTRTGYARAYKGESTGYIDAFAAGLWVENRGFIAYEVKQSRGDFLTDIESFASKQAVAIRNSTQFYYACQHGLIKPEEVPEVAGLMWVDGGGPKVKKVAPVRELASLDLDFCRAIMRAASGGATKKTSLWKYLGKDMTEDDILKIAEELGHLRTEKNIEFEARERAAKLRQRSWGILKKFAEAIDFRDLGWCDDESIEVVANKMVEAYRKSKEAQWKANDIMRGAKQIREASDALLQLVEPRRKDDPQANHT